MEWHFVHEEWCPSRIIDENRKALSSTAGKDLLDRLQAAEYKLADHGPEGRNYSNAQYVKLRNRLQKAEVVVEVAKNTCEELWGHGLIAIEALQKSGPLSSYRSLQEFRRLKKGSAP